MTSAEFGAKFGKDRRLRRRGEFQRVFDTGHRVRGRFLTLILARRPADGARLGIVASRKLGNSVHRNRAKRLIREIFRKNPPPAGMGGVDIVVIPRSELFGAGVESLVEDYRALLARCTTRLGKT